jgi:Uma2 family endonuclease
MILEGFRPVAVNTLAPPEQKVFLEVGWETYERLLAEHVNKPGTRFAYDTGRLEIMVVYAGHENPNRTLAQIVDIVAEETGRDLWPAGSTTFKRQDLEKGFEPDSSIYLDAHAEAVRRKEELDLLVDPPPDLVIEIDMTRGSLPRLPIFAAVGVPEVWRYDGARVAFYRLAAGRYEEIERSAALPPLTSRQAGVFLNESSRQKAPVWVRQVREWVRNQPG